MAKRTSRKKRHSRKRTSRKNGYSRRASRGLKGKRRSRSKRTSRRNTNYDYGMSHPGSYDSRGRPRRSSRRNPEDYWTQQIRAGSAQRFYVHAGGVVRGPFGKAVAMRVAKHHQDLHKGRSPVKVTEVDRDLKEKVVKVVANRARRRSRANQTFYIPIPPISKNRRRRSSRPNQTFYIKSPGPARNGRSRAKCTSRKSKRSSRKRTSRRARRARRSSRKRASRRNPPPDWQRGAPWKETGFGSVGVGSRFWQRDGVFGWQEFKKKNGNGDSVMVDHGLERWFKSSNRVWVSKGGPVRSRARRGLARHNGIARNPRLSGKRRSKLPNSKFVFPKDRAWPIESAKGARDAISYMKMGRVRNASDYMAIRTFILRHYPAVWKKYGMQSTWLATQSSKRRGIAHHRAHRKAAN